MNNYISEKERENYYKSSMQEKKQRALIEFTSLIKELEIQSFQGSYKDKALMNLKSL